MFCRECGAEIADGNSFCVKCGAPVERIQPAQGQQQSQRLDIPQPTSTSKKKTPLIIAAVVIALALAVVGIGLATGWFGFAASPQASQESTEVSEPSEEASGSSDGSDSSISSSESSEISAGDNEGNPNSAAATKQLKVGFDPTYPPYSYTADGQDKGIDLELAREVCKRNNWSFEAVPIDWDAKDSLLQSGEIDCIWSGFEIEGNEGAYTFSEPYIVGQNRIGEEDEDVRTVHIAVAFKHGDTETAKIVTETLREMYQDGTVEVILSEYIQDGSIFMDEWALR